MTGNKGIAFASIVRFLSWFKPAVIAFAVLALSSCSGEKEYRLTVIAPGHFHAALIQKHQIDGLARDVSVYAPEGVELDQYLETVASFNGRADNPTAWREKVYAGEDFMFKLPECTDGHGIVVLAGNNGSKTDYICLAVQKGYNVLSDKPMCIVSDGFQKLEEAYKVAQDKGLVIMDLMTERHDLHNILVRELLSDSLLFSQGRDSLFVKMSSTHYLYKNVAGKAVTRPEWYYDIRQQGEGIADVTTHLVDLVLWQCFQGQAVDYDRDVHDISASHQALPVSREQYSLSTGASSFPDYLSRSVQGDTLQLLSNGDIRFNIKDVRADIAVEWKFSPEAGVSDSFSAVYEDRDVKICLEQDRATNFRKELYIYGNQDIAMSAAERVCAAHAGLTTENVAGGVHLIVPDGIAASHEEHFGMVVDDFLKYCRDKEEMPVNEATNTLCKYQLLTTAVQIAGSSKE